MPPNNSALPDAEPALSASDRDMLEPGEHIVTVVHRTIVGIVLIYLFALIASVAVIIVGFLAIPSLDPNITDESKALLTGGVLIALVILSFFLLIATYIYRQSKLFVTDRSLVQVLQKGLFIRKVSRLSMSNVEDVTAEHPGFLPTIFDYGDLTIQTAGELENFIFPWCPTPDKYADRIIEARQAYAQHLQEDKEP